MITEILAWLRDLVSPRAVREGADASGTTLHLILESRKVARVAQVDVPQLSLADIHGRVYTAPRYVTVFDYEFEGDQLKVLRESRELAGRTGMRLELTDLTRQSALRRMVMRLGGVGVPGVVLELAPRDGACPPVEAPRFWGFP